MLEKLDHILPIKIPTYTNDKRLTDGKGEYSSDDWHKIRKDMFLDDPISWAYFMTKDIQKIKLGYNALSEIDFKKYKHVLELGCGNMVQAFIIANSRPELKYTASDFDFESINKLNQNVVLKNIHKKVLDCRNFTDKDLDDDVDCVVMWAVDYAISDDHLINILQICHRKNIDVFIYSPSIPAAKHWIKQMIFSSWYKNQISKGLKRVHGYSRNIKYLLNIGNSLGFKGKYLGKSCDQNIVKFYS